MQMLYINGFIRWNVIFQSIVSPTGRRLILHCLRLPPMSRTGGKLTVIKGPRNPICLQPPPLGTLFETLSRNFIIPWGDMRISTYSGPHYDNKRTKMCVS